MALSKTCSRQNLSPVVRTVSTQNFRLSERQYSAHMESPLHAHAKNYLIITLDGQYYSSFDTRTEEFTPWTVTYHREGTSHTSRYGSNGARVLYIELPAEQLKDLGQISASHLNHFSLQGGAVDWTARQLYSELKTSDNFSPMVMDSLIMQLLVHFFRWRGARSQRLPGWLGKADEIIRRRFMDPLGLAEIAKFVMVHPGHLSREYTRHYNCTIGEQIRRLRIEYACEQLSSTDRCLADIALAAGFSDQSHFTVTFKQHIGTAPSQYRKTVKSMLLSQEDVIHLQDAHG
jgi:AraC family transcriptional regulator